MQLSIIIVNYNVRYFLEQCLHAVLRAIKDMDAEIIVVDNHSSDGSMEYLQPLFPGIRFIINDQNLGFAKANNQALVSCNGEYVLFLNPDTLIPEDCLQRCLSFIKENPRAGALGVRMLDGRGRFLPESKRSFPSPLVSLYKLTGLAAAFPRSRIFNKYALGYLNEHGDHPVEVLAGAYMLVKKELLVSLNGFDESYFLYGEDIDLSFRIKQAGYENLYFGEMSIIHFKGESSADHGLNRVKFFYQAMMVFVRKHYHNGGAKAFSFLLQFAIACRAAVSAFSRIFRPVLVPVMDGLLVWASLLLTRNVWIHTIRGGKSFGVLFIPYLLPAFSLLFILTAAFGGLYDKKQQPSKNILSAAFAVLSMLAVYSLLPEQVRFSRGVILCGGILGALLVIISRQVFFDKKETEEQTVIVASETEYAEIKQLLEKAMLDENVLGRVALGDDLNNSLCNLEALPLLEKKMQVDRIIFCAGEFSMIKIIEQVQLFAKQNTRFLFHISGTQSIVGSHTLAPGATVVNSFVDYHISYPYQKRMKRVADIFLCFLFILSIPVHLLLYPRTGNFIRNIFRVAAGSRTWVGYASGAALLPPIKKGIISSLGKTTGFSETLLDKADRFYAKNYDWWQDITICLRNYRCLG